MTRWRPTRNPPVPAPQSLSTGCRSEEKPKACRWAVSASASGSWRANQRPRGDGNCQTGGSDNRGLDEWKKAISISECRHALVHRRNIPQEKRPTIHKFRRSGTIDVNGQLSSDVSVAAAGFHHALSNGDVVLLSQLIASAFAEQAEMASPNKTAKASLSQLDSPPLVCSAITCNFNITTPDQRESPSSSKPTLAFRSLASRRSARY